MIARPSATRCCWPPESCEGLRSQQRLQSEQRRDAVEPPRASPLGDAAHREPEHDVLGDRQMRKQRVGLEHHGDAARRRRSGREHRAPRSRFRRPSGSSSPAIRRSMVDLPQPDGPSRTISSPFSTAKETSSTARVAPHVLVTARTSTLIIIPPLARAASQASSIKMLYEGDVTLCACPDVRGTPGRSVRWKARPITKISPNNEVPLSCAPEVQAAIGLNRKLAIADP